MHLQMEQFILVLQTRAGLDHYGITHGHTCVGGVSRQQATQYGPLPASACNQPCSGDAAQTCGGGPTTTTTSTMSLYSFSPANPPPRPPPRAQRKPSSAAARPPAPPAPAPPLPAPPAPSRQVETQTLSRTAAVDLPALQEDVAINSSRRVIAVPPSSARGLILLHPAAVPVFTAATVGGGGALPLPNSTAPVIASARVGRLDGRLVAFGTEAMLTSCCGQAAVGFDASELGKVIVNAAQWAAAAAGAAVGASGGGAGPRGWSGGLGGGPQRRRVGRRLCWVRMDGWMGQVHWLVDRIRHAPQILSIVYEHCTCKCC